MTTAYQNSGNCKDELCFAKDKKLPVVAIKGESRFEASGWLGLVTAGSLWSEVLPEMGEEEFETKMDRFAEHVLLTDGINHFPAELVPPDLRIVSAGQEASPAFAIEDGGAKSSEGKVLAEGEKDLAVADGAAGVVNGGAGATSRKQSSAAPEQKSKRRSRVMGLVDMMTLGLTATEKEVEMVEAVHQITLKWKNDMNDFESVRVRSDHDVDHVLEEIHGVMRGAVVEKVAFENALHESTLLKSKDTWDQAVETAIEMAHRDKWVLKLTVVTASGAKSPKANDKRSFGPIVADEDLKEFICVLPESDCKKRSWYKTKSRAQKCAAARPAVHPYNASDADDIAVLRSVNYHGADQHSELIVYRLYSKRSERLYIPLAVYDQLVLDKKHNEFMEMARGLCARSIQVVDDKSASSSQDANAGVSAAGLIDAKASTTSSTSNDQSQTMEETFTKPLGTKPTFDESKTFFYQWEDSWKRMRNGRMGEGGAQTKSMKCTFQHESDSTVSADFKAGMDGIGLKVGGKKAQHMSVHFELSVSFWTGGAEDDDEV
jgi:hypothetical protein